MITFGNAHTVRKPPTLRLSDSPALLLPTCDFLEDEVFVPHLSRGAAMNLKADHTRLRDVIVLCIIYGL